MLSGGAVVVTVSDGVSQGTREDRSGPAVGQVLRGAGFDVVAHEVVADEREQIAAVLRRLAERVNLVVTTGGTGFYERDVTPEATRDVIDRDAPGLAEAMRAAGRRITPMADLSRGVAGTVGRCLIVNLPGSAKGAVESLEAIVDILPHALQLLAGDNTHHGESPPGT